MCTVKNNGDLDLSDRAGLSPCAAYLLAPSALWVLYLGSVCCDDSLWVYGIQLCVLAASLALLFQPIFKVALGRAMWNAVDVLVAVALIVLWYTHRK